MDKFKIIKKQFIEMMTDVKDFEAVTIKNKIYIDLILNIIDNTENDTFIFLFKNITDYLNEEINEKNFKEIIFKLVKEIKFIEIKDKLSFLSDLKKDETSILVKHLKILFAYILKMKNENENENIEIEKSKA